MDARRVAIATLALDRAAIEAVTTLRQAGIDPVLLKGRSFAEWLYEADEVRPYTDVDLLVPAGRWDDARAMLDGLGYHPYFSPRHDPPHASAHGRNADGASIDLHRTLQGLDASPAEVFDVLSQHTTTTRLGDVEVTILDEVGRCVGVAVHAGRSDVTGVRAREDLRRAVEVADLEAWRAARDLAARIGAGRAFATGLASESSAAALAVSLHVEGVAPAAVPPPRGANALARVTEAGSLPEALRALLPWLTPTPAVLRQVRPIARRGPAGLAVAYLTWPLWLVARVLDAHRVHR